MLHGPRGCYSRTQPFTTRQNQQLLKRIGKELADQSFRRLIPERGFASCREHLLYRDFRVPGKTGPWPHQRTDVQYPPIWHLAPCSDETNVLLRRGAVDASSHGNGQTPTASTSQLPGSRWPPSPTLSPIPRPRPLPSRPLPWPRPTFFCRGCCRLQRLLPTAGSTLTGNMRRGRRDLRQHEDHTVWLGPGSGACGAEASPLATLDDHDHRGTTRYHRGLVGGEPDVMDTPTGSVSTNAGAGGAATDGIDGPPSPGLRSSPDTDEDSSLPSSPALAEVIPGAAPAARPPSTSSSDDDDLSPYVLPEDELGNEADDDDAPPPSFASVSGSGSESSGGSRPFLHPCTSFFRSVEDLYALLLLRGQRGLREDQYLVVREGFNISSPVPLPSLSYVRATLTAQVSSWMLPTQSFSFVSPGSAEKVSVDCILPSSHVRRDVAFSATFENFLAAELRTDEERALEPEFIDSPLFNIRPTVLLAGETIQHFTLDGTDVSINDLLVIKLAAPHASRRVKVSDAYFLSHESGLSPGQSEHAGDFVVACDSLSGVSGCIIARHWLASQLPSMLWLSDCEGDELIEILSLHHLRTGDEGRGGTSTATVEDAPVRRKVSDLQEGVHVLTVSLCINSDDFETRRGKKQSLGGVYMSYTSLLYQHRHNSHGSRTISVTPSGVNSDEVLRAVTPDLVEGATSGWLCHRRDGSAVRVMADVAMFVGDYLQVVKTSMLMGYGAKAPCPLCSYRVPGVPGSRFGLHGSSSDVEMARTTARTRSICRAVQQALK